MNTEDSEFERIEAEAKRRAAQQVYTSESAEKYFYRCGYEAAKPPPEWEGIKNIIAEYGLDAIAFVAEWKAAQRPWVGLTDDEIRALASWWPSYDQMPALMVLAKEIQENLKERNNG